MEARIKSEYIDATCIPEIITCLLSFKDLYHNNTGIQFFLNYRYNTLASILLQTIYIYIFISSLFLHIPPLTFASFVYFNSIYIIKISYSIFFFIEWNQIKVNRIDCIRTSLFRTHTRSQFKGGHNKKRECLYND